MTEGTDEDASNEDDNDLFKDGPGKDLPIILTRETPLHEVGVRIIGMAYGSKSDPAYTVAASTAETYMRNRSAGMGGDCIIDPTIHEPQYIGNQIYVMMHCKVGQLTERGPGAGVSED